MSHPRSILAASATLLVAAGLAGCATADRTELPSAAETRDVRLAEPTSPEIVQISELEAGRPLTAASAAQAHRHQAPAAALPRVSADAALTIDQAPALSSTAVQTSELVAAPVPTAPAEEPVLLVGRGVMPEYASYGGYGTGASGGRGGPGVIIRGGRGGVDDDCDLDRPGHGPVAINQVARAPGGGGSIGVRARGMTFPRGIR